MDVGIGLPSAIPGVKARQVLDWARRAERRGFSSLAVDDRLVYGNDEPLITLAAAAAVTERINLVTAILIPTFRGNTALLAKQAASVDHLSGGRLVLGLAPGGREDDFTASGTSFSGRGQRFEQILEELGRIWDGESRGTAGAVGPTPPKGRPQVIIGGMVAKAHERVARYGAGWIAAGAPPEYFRSAAEQVRAAWSVHGRSGQPRLMTLGYFSLGADAEQHASNYLRDYYAFLGPIADDIPGTAFTNEDAVRSAVAAFGEAGADELILFPANPDPAQVDLLAGALST